MKKLIQTRIHKGVDKPSDRGNCYPTVIACFMDLDSPEDAMQIQEHYHLGDGNKWVSIWDKWLRQQGWELGGLPGHLNTDEFYLVTGKSKRGVSHVCIYQNGKLYHDPHPDQNGLITETHF